MTFVCYVLKNIQKKMNRRDIGMLSKCVDQNVVSIEKGLFVKTRNWPFESLPLL